MFQSTPPHGGRPNRLRSVAIRERVSIHAPAWGATSTCRPGRGKISGFNPRPRMGGDRRICHQSYMDRCFNPRPRMGGDCNGYERCYGPGPVSIHAPAWGATRTFSPQIPFPLVSIHAPAWGATHLRKGVKVKAHVSIHAPAWGATKAQGKCGPYRGFQSTPPHGGRRYVRRDQRNA